MNYRLFFKLLCFSLITTTIISCDEIKNEDNKISRGAPGSGNTGSFDASRYVAIGNSITAGYMSGSLYESAQIYSYPQRIAIQAHGISENGLSSSKFQSPVIAEPGLGGPPPGVTTQASWRIELGGYTTSGSPITFINTSGFSQTQLKNATLARPYNNLGIPGIVLGDATLAITASNSVSKSGFIDPILRNANPAFGNTSPVQQARSLLTPASGKKLVTFWLGNNDVLGYATSGGISPSAPTNSATFTALLNQAIDSLRLIPDVKIIVANIPDVTSIPFVTTVGPSVKLVFGIGQAGGQIPTSLPGVFYHKTFPNAFPTDTATIMLAADIGDLSRSTGCAVLLTGGSVATGLGSTRNPASSTWRTLLRNYRANAGLAPFFGATAVGSSEEWQVFRTTFFKPALDTAQPFGLTPAHPIPNQWVLDNTEIARAKQSTAEFNASIAGLVPTKAVALVDINALFNQIIANNGITVDGELLKAGFGTGGLFTMDGVHPSPKAHGIVANRFIEIINREFNASIPLIDISTLPNGIVQAGQGSAITTGGGTNYQSMTPELMKSTLYTTGAFRNQK